MVIIHEQTKKYSWDGMEFEHREKSTDWYWILGIAAVTGIVLCVIAKNYLLAILIAISAGILGFFANEKPDPVHVELSEQGIRLDKDLYQYETVQSFWIYRDYKNRDRLIIMTGRPVMPQRIITLPETPTAVEIRNYLSDYIPEKETKQSLIDLLAESIGM